MRAAIPTTSEQSRAPISLILRFVYACSDVGLDLVAFGGAHLPGLVPELEGRLDSYAFEEESIIPCFADEVQPAPGQCEKIHLKQHIEIREE